MAKSPNTYSRRAFTKLTAMGIAATPLLSFQKGIAPEVSSKSKALEVHLFSKHLQFLNYDEMSAAAANMGFNGLDLTVRPKGHVLPENVIEDLPKAVAAMTAQGLSPKMMTTNIWDAQQTEHQMVLQTASRLGFTHYRTNWLKYPERKSISESQALFAAQAKALEALNASVGLIGGYQNHAGKYVGSAVWDLVPILEATKGQFMGCHYDIRHATVEANGSWELGLKRIAPYINAIVLKDVKWGLVNGIWKPDNVPMGEGMVNFKRYFSLLKAYNINVPISLHAEYDLGGAEKGHSTIKIAKKDVLRRIKKDLDFVRNLWNSIE